MSAERTLFRSNRVIHRGDCRHNVWQTFWVAGNQFRSLIAQEVYADSQNFRGCKVCRPFEASS